MAEGRTKSGDSGLSYGDAANLAKNGSLEQRRNLAAAADTKPEILYYLVDDPAPEVRRELAANETTPIQADLRLARDEDQQVREGLAAKIARLLPGMTEAQLAKVRAVAHEALETLARDQATVVRRILADTLKDVAKAPPQVIRQLARDVEAVVACPVLEFSPVLSDRDLLDIIAAAPVQATEHLGAIARRSTVSAPVSDAIIDTENVDAIAHLLANDSAQVREETLDRVIEQAAEVTEWQPPLVNRPALPNRAARRLAELVAENLLETLVSRRDLDPETAEVVLAKVQERLKDAGKPMPKVAAGGGEGWAEGEDAPDEADAEAADEEDEEDAEPERLTRDEAMALATKLNHENQLTEGVIADAMGRRDRQMVFASLAVLTAMPVEVVVKAFANHSAKGIVSLTWESGMSPRMAIDLQQGIGGVAPVEIIRPSSTAAYGLSEEEMTWQLEFLKGLG